MNRIKEVLEAKGIKQTWLAEQLGKSFPLKFKDKVKEFDAYKNDVRFKTNVNAFLNLLNEVILQK